MVTTNYRKSALEKALKARLVALTEGLAGADIGEKGIDLVKEIKELHSMIAALNPATNNKKAENSNIVVVWGPPEQAAQPPKNLTSHANKKVDSSE